MDVCGAARVRRRGDQPFGVEEVGIHQIMHYGLEVVRVGAADVGGDDHAEALARERAADGLRHVGPDGVRVRETEARENGEPQRHA